MTYRLLILYRSKRCSRSLLRTSTRPSPRRPSTHQSPRPSASTSPRPRKTNWTTTRRATRTETRRTRRGTGTEEIETATGGTGTGGRGTGGVGTETGQRYVIFPLIKIRFPHCCVIIKYNFMNRERDDRRDRDRDRGRDRRDRDRDRERDRDRQPSRDNRSEALIEVIRLPSVLSASFLA